MEQSEFWTYIRDDNGMPKAVRVTGIIDKAHNIGYYKEPARFIWRAGWHAIDLPSGFAITSLNAATYEKAKKIAYSRRKDLFETKKSDWYRKTCEDFRAAIEYAEKNGLTELYNAKYPTTKKIVAGVGS